MTLTRRGFLGALAAVLAVPKALASAIRPKQLQLPILRDEVLAVTDQYVGRFRFAVDFHDWKGQIYNVTDNDSFKTPAGDR